MHWNQQKTKKILKSSLFGGIFLVVAGGIFFFWNHFHQPFTLTTYTDSLGDQGREIQNSFLATPAMPLTSEGESFVFQDIKGGIQIEYAQAAGAESIEANNQKGIKVALPKDYSKPIEIKLDKSRVVTIKDNTTEKFESSLLEAELSQPASQGDSGRKDATQLQKLFNFNQEQGSTTYLQYQNQRKSILYAYQKDSASGERKMKHWTVYNQGSGEEKESYKIEGATIKKNDNGDINVYYQSEQDLKNQAVAKEVPEDLMARAERTLEKELGKGNENPNQTPDFIIPKPYYLTKDNQRQDLEWIVDEETKEISISFQVSIDQYPIALDPTLQFAAPGAANGGVAITGEVSGSGFSKSLMSGDLNSDGKTDLIVGANSYSSSIGRTYIFYNDSSISTTAATADVIITGESVSQFGYIMTVGDLNADSRIDLVIGAPEYSSSTGRTYIFYNDGSIPTTAATADVIITGQTTSNSFGVFTTTGDLNTDGKTDLIVGANSYSSSTGRAYIFYNDGSIPTTAATADVIITGETTSNSFGGSLTTGDLNADGRTDLVVGSSNYSSFTGRAYIFYNDGSIPTTAATADVIITGETTSNLFGGSLTTGDLNADGKTDLVVGSYGYSTDTGRTYVFYNDGSIPTTAATADVMITGEATSSFFGVFFTISDFNADGRMDLIVGASSYSTNTGRTYIFYSQNGVLNVNRSIAGETSGNGFGRSLASGDFNADGRIDLAASAPAYSTDTGRAYIFYNDGSIPTTAATADVIITGNALGDGFAIALTSGDLNTDGKTDLIVGAYGYSSNTGRAYIFYNDGSIPTTAATADVTITGENANDRFGWTLETGDLNADSKTDLVVGAYGYGSNTGRTYIFYNDGSIPTTAATADVIIAGGTAGDNFSYSFTVGDLNADGRIDLAIGAFSYSSETGRAYIFYNDGSIPTTAATADVIITGETTNNRFGASLAVGDLNADGKKDLIVGATWYSSNLGRGYIFYNDGSYPANASSADVAITGSTDDQLGITLTTGDLNTDGREDLIVGAWYPAIRHTYVFYNDGSIPTTAATADVDLRDTTSSSSFGYTLEIADLNSDGKVDLVVGAYNDVAGKMYFYEGQANFSWTLQQQPLGSSRVSPNVAGEEIKITGEGGSNFGGEPTGLLTGDFNNDGKIDLAVGDRSFGSTKGRVYLFYNDGDYPSGATSADTIITGETGYDFGYSLTSGDLNTDGTADLIVGAIGNSTGRVHIFYNDGLYPTTADTADIIITGNAASDSFGTSVVTGDLNFDGKTDLIVGAQGYSTETGRAYIFYNDGSIPTTAATADVTITGETTNNRFGSRLTVGDLNADGRIDLVVGAMRYSSFMGRAYIFYNDGSIPTTAATADVTITGETTNDYFSYSITTGDMNADSKIDLVVGAYGYSTETGRAYIFYNGSIVTENASGADVTITGESTNNDFGYALTMGDLNADGKADLVVGGVRYSSFTGRAYIFYNDGSIPTTAATADVTITGEATSNSLGTALVTSDMNADGKVDLVTSGYLVATGRGRIYMYTFNDKVVTGSDANAYFGYDLMGGDFNSDGRVDLVVGAYGYSTNTGRAYIFYNGSSATTLSGADVVITGETTSNYFGLSIGTGDLNADGKVDLIVGSYQYSSSTGRTYVFYNGSIITENASGADVIITGESSSYFGISFATGDLNADGKIDLVVGGQLYTTSTGRAYIFYNDGSIPTTAATADVVITGETTSNYFGRGLDIGDFNADGKQDLAVGSFGYSSSTGRTYVFYNGSIITENASGADVIITGESNSQMGRSITSGDFNADGREDIAVGAEMYSSNTGRAYIFYNDGSIPTAASSADVTITGEATNNYFAYTLRSGDLNADGKTDVIVGAYGYSSSTGRVYVYYNDGSYSSLASGYDKVYTGSATGASLGVGFQVVDMNIDSKPDFIVGESGYSGNAGRVYTYITETEITSVDTEVMNIKGGMNLKGSMIVK